MNIKKEVKTLHKTLIDTKIPHIISFIEGDVATVIIAGTTQNRKDLLESILADKGWKELEDEESSEGATAKQTS